MAQLGEGWVEFAPERVLHLGNLNQEKQTFRLDRDADKECFLGSPATAAYSFIHGEGLERFRLNAPGERAEVRVKNDYSTGAQQFEGRLTLRATIERQMVFQIWGSGQKDRATQMFLRGYDEDGGSLRVFLAGKPSRVVATRCYDREIQVNVIHLQEDVGGRILVFFDGKVVVDEVDVFAKIVNNKAGNYHKYGCYGSFEGDQQSVAAEWRQVQHFRGGGVPNEGG